MGKKKNLILKVHKVNFGNKNINRILEDLHSTQKGLYKQCISLENVIDEISEYLSPQQIGSFLMKMERVKRVFSDNIKKYIFYYLRRRKPKGKLKERNYGFLNKKNIAQETREKYDFETQF